MPVLGWGNVPVKQLNLDGAIRVSGVGMPSWDAMATGLSLKEDWTNRMVEQ